MRAIWSAKRFNCAQCIVVNNNATRDVTREAILLIPVHIRIRNNTAIFRQFYGNFADFLSIWTVSEHAWNKCLPICIGNITATFPALCIWTRLMWSYPTPVLKLCTYRPTFLYKHYCNQFDSWVWQKLPRCQCSFGWCRYRPKAALTWFESMQQAGEGPGLGDRRP